MSGYKSWALLGRHRFRFLLAQLWDSGQVSVGPGSAEFWAASQNSREDAAADRRTAREASLYFDSSRLYQQSHEGTDRRCCAGLSRLPQEPDHSPHPTEVGHWNSSLQCGVRRGGANRLEWRAPQTGAEREREQGRSKTGIVSMDLLENGKNTWMPLFPFAGAGQRRRLFRGLDILTIKWATGDLPEECRFLLNTQLIYLKKEKDPASKQFDDDEWIRSSVTYDQQEVDPKKVRPIQTGEFLRKYVSRRLLALSEGEIAALTTSIRQIGVGTPGGAEALPIFHQLLFDERMAGSLSGPLARIKVDEKFFFGMIEWKAVREAAWRFLP